MKKKLIIILTIAVLVAAVAAISTLAADLPFTNLFKADFAGYTSDDGQIRTDDFVSSQQIAVNAGDEVWFGPCQSAQYFHLVGQDASGANVTGKLRGKALEKVDTFGNETVIYKYTVPSGVSNLVFSVPGSLKDVYTVSKTEMSVLTWTAYWSQQGVDTEQYVGQSSYYEVKAGQKVFFGAITEAKALESTVYNGNGSAIGTIAAADLRLVESFGGDFGIYCYTVPSGQDIAYLDVKYDPKYEQYYTCIENGGDMTDAAVVDHFIDYFGVALPLDSTVSALSGKTALFLGDSITYGARDRANIYGVKGTNAGAGGWAARIGYYAGMDVTNNGVSGACISTAREQSNSEKHYIYNNLVETKGTTYDYVIMHGLFNDASEGVDVGTMIGKAAFAPSKADVTTYAGGLEMLFYTARQQNPDAILGFIVNFKTDRSVNQAPYVDMAIRICENWGVEYLDLYHNDGFSVEFDDGLHPSSVGYDSMYTLVANWMATLDGNLSTNGGNTAKVMSYNVYFGADTPSGVADIENRYQKTIDLIKAQSPDIIMLQEVTGTVYAPLAQAQLGGTYSFFGEQHKSSSDELAPIAWKKDLYTQVETGTLKIDDADYPRTINYVVLEDAGGQKLLAMSVHGQPDKDGGDKTAVRNETMLQVAAKVKEIQAKYEGIPAVVGGDFNIAVGSQAYLNLTNGGLSDVRATVNPGASGSYNAWTRMNTSVSGDKYAMGDYLFISGSVNATAYQVITNDLDTGRSDDVKIHISDHCPIVMEIEY